MFNGSQKINLLVLKLRKKWLIVSEVSNQKVVSIRNTSRLCMAHRLYEIGHLRSFIINLSCYFLHCILTIEVIYRFRICSSTSLLCLENSWCLFKFINFRKCGKVQLKTYLIWQKFRRILRMNESKNYRFYTDLYFEVSSLIIRPIFTNCLYFD